MRLVNGRKSILQVIEAIIERDKEDGCRNCAFESKDDWEMPCAKCKRNCKDYFRFKEIE